MRVGTIADVCRGAAINRQQFNRYLSGAAIPNARTLARICEFLEISETQLFQTQPVEFQTPAANNTTGHISWEAIDSGFAQMLSTFRSTFSKAQPSEVASRHVQLKESTYYCYFPLQNFEQFVVRSLIIVRYKNGVGQFRRFTRFKSPSLSSANLAVGKHFGHIYSDNHQTYLIGLNRLPPNNLSLLAFEQSSVPGRTVQPGLAIMQGNKGTFACRICLEELDNSFKTIKSALKSVGIVTPDDPSVNPMVAKIMKQPSPTVKGQLSTATLEESLVYSQLNQ